MGKKSREKKEKREQEEKNNLELYTIYEVADMLKVHHMTIRNKIRSKHIKVVDISSPGAKQRSLRITRQELDRIIS